MSDSKSAFVAIVGKPNVGKSSLMNTVLGEKIAIVSNKPQTTRTKITGVLTKNNTQFVFVDTPGLHKPANKLSEYMVKAVHDSIVDVDIVVLVSDPFGEISKEEQDIIENIKKINIPSVLVINKIDLADDKTQLLSKSQAFNQQFEFDNTLFVSVLKQNGIDKFLDVLDSHAVESIHFFPDDTLTDQPERVIVAEIIREKILEIMFQEVPHGTVVEIERMRERKGKSIIDIDATIYCERSRHKGMIIGKNGEMLKKIASLARKDIEKFLDIKVNLQCWVKVQDDWRNKETFIKNFGLK